MRAGPPPRRVRRADGLPSGGHPARPCSRVSRRLGRRARRGARHARHIRPRGRRTRGGAHFRRHGLVWRGRGGATFLRARAEARPLRGGRGPPAASRAALLEVTSREMRRPHVTSRQATRMRHVHLKSASGRNEARHMRRQLEVLGRLARATFRVPLTLLLATAPAYAGLIFSRVDTLPGADATALAGGGATLWAATPRGAWRLDAGAWTLDGLSAQAITSIVVADTVYAADGQNVWRRGADGTWTAETLPASLSAPSVLATDGATLWAAGLGVAKRSSGTWAALGSPSGSVTAASVYAGDLVVGLRGGAAQYAGATVIPISTGLSITSTVQALAVVNGTLYAGTDQTLYSLSGASWTAVPGFGAHDVRAVTGAGGTLRAATVDAGVLSNVGSWVATNAGLLVSSAKSFATLGSDLYVGTAGAPVYRL